MSAQFWIVISSVVIVFAGIALGVMLTGMHEAPSLDQEDAIALGNPEAARRAIRRYVATETCAAISIICFVAVVLFFS